PGEPRAVGGHPGRPRVGRGETDDGARSRQELLRIGPDPSGFLEVPHSRVPAGVDPALEAIESRGGSAGASAAASRGTFAGRPFAEDPRGQQAVGRRHPPMLASAAQETFLPTTDRFASRVFNLTVLAVLGYLLFRIFEPFLGPIFWAILLAVILF